MSTIFDDKVFDASVFASTPKCIGEFYQGKARCLLNAFWQGFGIINKSLLLLLNDTDTLALQLKVSGSTDEYGFSDLIVRLYDGGKEIEALELIWELIEKLPAHMKKNPVTINKVIMPQC